GRSGYFGRAGSRRRFRNPSIGKPLRVPDILLDRGCTKAVRAVEETRKQRDMNGKSVFPRAFNDFIDLLQGAGHLAVGQRSIEIRFRKLNWKSRGESDQNVRSSANATSQLRCLPGKALFGVGQVFDVVRSDEQGIVEAGALRSGRLLAEQTEGDQPQSKGCNRDLLVEPEPH